MEVNFCEKGRGSFWKCVDPWPRLQEYIIRPIGARVSHLYKQFRSTQTGKKSNGDVQELGRREGTATSKGGGQADRPNLPRPIGTTPSLGCHLRPSHGS